MDSRMPIRKVSHFFELTSATYAYTAVSIPGRLPARALTRASGISKKRVKFKYIMINVTTPVRQAAIAIISMIGLRPMRLESGP